MAATLRPEARQKIAIEALSKTKPITHLAQEYQVSRKFIRIQRQKAKVALDESFEPTPPDEQVLFHVPVTHNWLFQLILSLVFICHSSLRGVVELLRDVFHFTRSVPVQSAIALKQRQRALERSTRNKICRGLR